MYPLVNHQFAIENGPVEIVDLAMKNGGSFHSYVNVYQRVIMFTSRFMVIFYVIYAMDI